MSYLRYLCLFAYCGVQHILCCVSIWFFFVLCTLCCPDLIVSSVFSNIYFRKAHSLIVLNESIKQLVFKTECKKVPNTIKMSGFLHVKDNFQQFLIS